ncbi:RNA polymerase sigma factor [Dyadobacter pollutisoli]|uniref:Sigma-70 family RNA polymerase sigma factor n=1 Tax=Dyadobacter pollutisoli TaxID=2910158 RepID=A0A9E8SMP6_9BACT|nr:sigma-70 family RNA polymerase sigma factor [Dyadobacter pollutisoli]WAC14985.1 sigma-70 family RNA polymerase sigma factor [Dyadobacter pollutisoli]
MEKFTPNHDSELSSEWNIWHCFKQGNHQAFETLYKDYFKILNNYGSRLTSDSQLLEDAIHDVFIDLWRRKEYLADVENIRFYLFRALRNRIIRNGKNIFENKEDIDKFLDYLVSLSYEDQSIDSERMRDKTARIQNAIANLSERQREVINLRFYHALSLDEISILMGLSKQCVSNLLFKSYAVLRLKLKELSMLSTLTSLLVSQC